MNLEIPDKVEKASKWTVYCLIDLRVVFIITYVYISVVNLISTTANAEATADTNSMTLFNITSKPEHANVSISFIDNAVLWNCREHSVTKTYYKGLYWMLIAAFVATLIAFTITKLAILCGTKHGFTSLWHIAVVKYLQEEVEGLLSATTYTEPRARQVAYCYKQLLTKEYYKEHKEDLHNSTISHLNAFRMTALFLSTIGLPFAILLSFLSYDLHPLSCILAAPSEDSIVYNVTTEAVHINFSENVLLYQKVMAGIIVVIGVCFIINVFCFYCVNYCIIDMLKTKVNVKISEIYKQMQSSSNT